MLGRDNTFSQMAHAHVLQSFGEEARFTLSSASETADPVRSLIIKTSISFLQLRGVLIRFGEIRTRQENQPQMEPKTQPSNAPSIRNVKHVTAYEKLQSPTKHRDKAKISHPLTSAHPKTI